MARKISLPITSRYRFSQLLQGPKDEAGSETITFFGTLQRPDLEKEPEQGFITVKSPDNGRLDVLSARLYGSSSYWWLLAMANDVFDPIYGVEAGTVYKVPKARTVLNKENQDLI